ncbi:hypothetical protein ACFLQZ_04420 [Acidobacteriota bacterium]
MKKEWGRALIRISFLMLFFLVSTHWIFAAAETGQNMEGGLAQKKTENTKIFSVKIKGAYFHPSRTSFRDTYTNKLMGEGEFTVRIFKFIELWLGGNHYNSMGKLQFSQEDTTMTLIGLGGGPKFKVTIGAFSPYLGFGPLVYFYKESNPIGTVQGNKIGYIGQAGFYFSISKKFFLDLFLILGQN